MKSLTYVTHVPEPPFARFLFANPKMAWFWFIVRVYVGYEWLLSGWGKLGNPAWTGDNAGTAVTGFLKGALAKTSGLHPDVTSWYAAFIQNFALPNAETFSYLIAYGETAVGIALILGLLTGIAAFFGTFLNLNFLFAGTVSINPVLLFLQLFLIMAWLIAGWHGLDKWVLPKVGVPWAGNKF